MCTGNSTGNGNAEKPHAVHLLGHESSDLARLGHTRVAGQLGVEHIVQPAVGAVGEVRAEQYTLMYCPTRTLKWRWDGW